MGAVDGLHHHRPPRRHPDRLHRPGLQAVQGGVSAAGPWKRHLGTIKGDFWGFDFKIVDHTDHEIAKVNRQVADLGDLFTAADTYVLWPRYPTLPEPLKTLVIASGITVDLVLAEGKR